MQKDEQEEAKTKYLEALYAQKGKKFIPEECDLFLEFNPLYY